MCFLSPQLLTLELEILIPKGGMLPLRKNMWLFWHSFIKRPANMEIITVVVGKLVHVTKTKKEEELVLYN
jgi:hypothetical protein